MSAQPPATLAARISQAAERGGVITFIGSRPDSAERVPWSQLHADARAMAAALQARGVEPGDHVALLGPTSRGLVTAIQATWLAGATVVVLPLPMRLGSFEEFVSQTRARIASADTDAGRHGPRPGRLLGGRAGDPPRALLSELVGPGRRSGGRRPPTPTGWRSCSSPAARPPSPRASCSPTATSCANLDGAMAAAHFDPDSRRGGVLAAAVSRHGPARASDHPHDHRRSTWRWPALRTSCPLRPAGWSG